MMVLLSIAGAAFAQDTGVPANPGHIELAEWPGEYCADIIGGSVELGDLLQAHTCSTRVDFITPDQKFETDVPEVGNIYIPEAALCVGATRVEAAGRLRVVECSTTDRRQMWVSTDDGQIHPVGDADLCWAMETRGPAASGNHKRELTLQPCSDIPTRFTVWLLPGGSVGS